jgi:propionyl-CoA carboxylase alpha chain
MTRQRPQERSFDTLLVANRGEIACRVMRSAREMGLRCVAVYVAADAEAPFVNDADEAVHLEKGYLDGKAILEAARATGAGAIHPGYGFLSENARFATDVIAAGLAWVGPSPEAIAQMGDKLAAKRLAGQNDVPCLPGSEDPEDASSIGYPLLVKAAAGGGGKGMRVVANPDQLEEAIAAARREAASGFGDDRIFLERFVARARHVEIQILGDAYGDLVHLGERECSIQRRHQKILEESPSPRVDPALRAAMGAAALKLARALDYRSAGTVEFLVDDETGEFFFLEVNTRLQVEHPVTEEVTGIDLVRAQLRIAAGLPLDFTQADLRFEGAAIEARLYAENPARDFLPTTGRLEAWLPATTPTVRIDTGVRAGSIVGTDFDPLLAKVIAHAPTRAEAAGRLALALERLHLGGIATNRDFLVATLRSPEFRAGDTTTDFIDRVSTPRSTAPAEADLERVARTAALWLQGANRDAARVLRSAPSGWRNGRLPLERIGFRRTGGGRDDRAPDGSPSGGTGGGEDRLESRLEVAYRSLRDGRFQFEDGSLARIFAWSPEAIDVEVDGRRHRARVTPAADRLIVQGPRGDVELEVEPRFVVPGPALPSGGLVAPMPGRVLDVRVQPGDRVAIGQTLILLEAMKMEHPIQAPRSGLVVQIHVAASDQVENGALLLTLEPESQGSPESAPA